MSCELRRAGQTVSDVFGLPVFSRRDTDATLCLGVVGRENDGGACVDRLYGVVGVHGLVREAEVEGGAG